MVGGPVGLNNRLIDIYNAEFITSNYVWPFDSITMKTLPLLLGSKIAGWK